jgi:hypothetical protein
LSPVARPVLAQTGNASTAFRLEDYSDPSRLAVNEDDVRAMFLAVKLYPTIAMAPVAILGEVTRWSARV